MSTESVLLSNHLILCGPLLLCLQSFPASGSLPMSQLFTWGSQSIGALEIYAKSIYISPKYDLRKDKEQSIVLIIIPLQISNISCVCLSYFFLSHTPFKRHCTRGLVPSCIFYTGPGDYENLTHTLSGFLTEVPPAVTAVQRARMVANVEKLSVVHTLHLAWEVFTPFRSSQILPSIQVLDQTPPLPGRLATFAFNPNQS